MGNVGYAAATAEAAISSDDSDLISSGRPYISNPDLVEQFAIDWPLAEPADMPTWYSHDENGYTDYPAFDAMSDLSEKCSDVESEIVCSERK